MERTADRILQNGMETEILFLPAIIYQDGRPDTSERDGNLSGLGYGLRRYGRQTGYFRTGWKPKNPGLALHSFWDGRPDTSERDGNPCNRTVVYWCASGRQTGYFRTGWKLSGNNIILTGLSRTADRILQNGMETHTNQASTKTDHIWTADRILQNGME